VLTLFTCVCVHTLLQQSDAEWLTLGHSKGHSKGVLAPGESHIITLYLNRYAYMHAHKALHLLTTG
jgi:hypothetical protein